MERLGDERDDWVVTGPDWGSINGDTLKAGWFIIEFINIYINTYYSNHKTYWCGPKPWYKRTVPGTLINFVG